jgi:amino acid adenylation domain-containing protein
MRENLAAGFLRSAELYPRNPALAVAGKQFSYAELAAGAAAIAAALHEHTPPGGPLRTAVFAHRSHTAFAGVLAALFSGCAYVPLNRTFPVARTRAMLERSRSRAVVVDEHSLPQLEEVLAEAPNPLLVLAPDVDDPREIAGRLPGHTVLGRAALGSARPQALPHPELDAAAYLLFTSGSTGRPKGVLVAHRNVVPFVQAMADRYGIDHRDRCSQTFDLTFDLSVFDMFVTWECGAELHCLSEKARLKPGDYIRAEELTVWFSVPSSGLLLKRFGMLKPDTYPSLRWSLFCGEALPADLASAWAAAAPGSTLENLYGPTEATIACTVYRWNPEYSPAECRNGIVPIGQPTPGMRTRIVDEELQEVGDKEDGELLVAGPQISLGYLDDPERTAAAFVVPPGSSQLHYRTGDRVARLASADLHYLGRADDQVQVRGHRVELGEVEAAIREALGVEGVIALGWPRTEAGAEGIVAFVQTAEQVEVPPLRAALADRLPDYMVPRSVHVVDEFPLNANGKFDRAALRARLEAQ